MNSTITKRYRVLATTTIGFVDPKVDTTVKWEGTDTDELSREFPPSDIMFADPFDQKEIEDGFIITRFTFEQQLTDGSWENIDDPRRRLTPMTDYERAIDAENRRDFPGDYITYCEDCGYDDCRCDDYRVECTSCNDYGCVKCEPDRCWDCDDHGCAKCDPQGVCTSCKHYDDRTDKVSGLCQNCAYYASLRYCEDCRDELNDSEEGNLCAHCEHYRSLPICSDNCHEFADGDDGLCSGCRYYYATKCSDCGDDLPDGDDGLCTSCRHNDAVWRNYYVWWRRALRACKFWR
jgi:hypothetical protein